MARLEHAQMGRCRLVLLRPRHLLLNVLRWDSVERSRRSSARSSAVQQGPPVDGGERGSTCGCAGPAGSGRRAASRRQARAAAAAAGLTAIRSSTLMLLLPRRQQARGTPRWRCRRSRQASERRQAQWLGAVAHKCWQAGRIRGVCRQWQPSAVACSFLQGGDQRRHSSESSLPPIEPF